MHFKNPEDGYLVLEFAVPFKAGYYKSSGETPVHAVHVSYPGNRSFLCMCGRKDNRVAVRLVKEVDVGERKGGLRR